MGAREKNDKGRVKGRRNKGLNMTTMFYISFII